MKGLLAILATGLLALPVAAEEKPKAQKNTKAEVAQPADAAAESPLVAAARRSKRGTTKTVVITDEMVKNSKGHVTTSTINYMPTVPEKAPPTSEMVMLEERAKAREAEQKKAAEAKAAEEREKLELQRRARLADSGENYEDGYDEQGADPAQLEREMAAEAQKEEKQP